MTNYFKTTTGNHFQKFKDLLDGINEFMKDNDITFENYDTVEIGKISDFIEECNKFIKDQFGGFLTVMQFKENIRTNINHKLKTTNLFDGDDNLNLKNCIILYLIISKNMLSIRYKSEYIQVVLDMFFTYCEKINTKKREEYKPFVKISELSEENLSTVKENPSNYYIEYKNIQYANHKPQEILDYIQNYPKIEQIKSIECSTKSPDNQNTVDLYGGPAASFFSCDKINEKEIYLIESDNFIVQKNVTGGKRRRSRNRKSKKSRKSRKNRRKSKRRSRR